MFGIVYLAKNKIDGKVYVGITTKTLEERIFAHLNRANLEKSYFQRSLKKYGRKTFEFSVIDQASSKEELSEKEIFWIKHYNSLDKTFGYNLTEGGEGISNMTQEIRMKISNTKKGVPNTKLKSRIYSTETRIKISKTLKGKPVILTNIATGEVIRLETLRSCLRYGLSPKNLSLVLRGKRHTVKGFTAKYESSHANTEGDTKGLVHL